MKKLLLSVFSSALIVAGANAQCATNYIDEIFSAVDTVSVTYSTTNQQMTIYTPQGDNSTSRPLLVLAHGGSFVGGDRYEPTIVKLCNNFAKRGYVTASIDYRLATSQIDMIFPSTAYPVVVKALSDAKAAVRYFTKDAANSNVYKIDVNQMYLGGNSAGAVLSIQYAYIDDSAELDATLAGVLAANGGIEGNSGNAGYPSKVKGILNLAGGILDTSWIEDNTEEAIASFHGTADNTVPYYCGAVLGGASQVTLCGTGAMAPRYERLGVPSVTKIYPNDPHVPWESSAAKFNEVDSISADFLGQRICLTTSVKDLNNLSSSVSVYPNPAKEYLQVEYSGDLKAEKVRMIDALGREVASSDVLNNRTKLNTSGLQNGIYFVETSFGGNQRVTKRVLIAQ